jgi:hypothetical protein
MIRHKIIYANDQDLRSAETCGRYGRSDTRGRKYFFDDVQLTEDEFYKAMKAANYDMENPCGYEIIPQLSPSKYAKLKKEYSEVHGLECRLRDECYKKEYTLQAKLNEAVRLSKLKSAKSHDKAKAIMAEVEAIIAEINSVFNGEEYRKAACRSDELLHLITDMPHSGSKAAARQCKVYEPATFNWEEYGVRELKIVDQNGYLLAKR